MPQSITKEIHYSARRNDDGTVQLRVEVERITFVEEIIPDGQMAGMKGHREVPCTDELTFDLHPGQALALVEDIRRALGD